MNQENNTSLSDTISIVVKWKKFISLFVLLALLIAAVFSFFILPKQYYAGTTVLPVNSMLTDKARIFNNIQELYSVYGNADDLDRIYTIAKAGNVLGFVVDSLKLVEHFNIDAAAEAGRTKAVSKLKENVSISKTENGALQIDVWDKDANTAASIANLIVYKTESLGSDLLKQANNSVIEILQKDIEMISQKINSSKDSVVYISPTKTDVYFPNNELLLKELDKDRNILHEFELASGANQSSLLVLEKAYPSLKADRPKHWLILASTFLLSLLFAVCAAIVLNRIKK